MSTLRRAVVQARSLVCNACASFQKVGLGACPQILCMWMTMLQLPLGCIINYKCMSITPRTLFYT